MNVEHLPVPMETNASLMLVQWQYCPAILLLRSVATELGELNDNSRRITW